MCKLNCYTGWPVHNWLSLARLLALLNPGLDLTSLYREIGNIISLSRFLSIIVRFCVASFLSDTYVVVMFLDLMRHVGARQDDDLFKKTKIAMILIYK